MGKWLLGLLLISLLIFGCVSIQPEGPVKIHNQSISGEIKQDQIWSGIIHVTGDIWMDEEVILTIMPGTTILISAGRDDQNKGNSLSGAWELEKVGPLYTEEYAKSHIEIVGRIIAVGQPDKMIRFTSDSPTPNYADWSEIRLYPDSRIEYNIIEYGRGGIAWQGHEDVKDANISISNSIIQHVFWGCIALGPGSWRIVSNTISDCGSEGIDIEPHTGKPYIAGNIITNSTVGIATTRGASPIIENNTLIDNVKGIVSRANDTITHNSISSPSRKIHEQSYMGYTFPYIAEPQVITFTGIQIAENPVSTIKFNDISNTQRGISIGPESFPVLTLRNNNIHENDYNIYSDANIAVDASNNWWGTTNVKEIEKRIWVSYPGVTRLGMIKYAPISNVPIPGAGICCSFCSDGTLVGACSTSNTSYYCDASKNLVFNCEYCGCSAGQVCVSSTCIGELIAKQLTLAAELGLPEDYKAEFLIKPDLLSPISVTTTPDDQLLVAEHYGRRLLRINPSTAEIDVLYNVSGEWGGLISDGAGGAYLSIRGEIAHITGNGTYTLYSPHYMNPAALGPNGEVYGYTKSDVLVLQSKDGEPKTIATGFSFIIDLVRDKEGNLYVSDWDMGTITRVKPDGTKQLLSSALNQRDPIDLGFAPDGTLYVNEGAGRFSQVDKNSGAINRISWFGGSEAIHPTDFAFLSNGKAYFVDPTHNNILGVDLQKEKVELIVRGEGNSRALDVGQNGAVYIGDSNGYPFHRSRILRIQLNGSVEVYADNLDAIIDLSFAPNGNMFVTTKKLGDKLEYHGSSVLLITPTREVKTLASWYRESGARTVGSISVNPRTGLAIVYDQGNNKLISVDENGNVSELPHSFDFDTQMVYLDHSADGTLYATETNKEGYDFGPLVERNIIRFDEKGNPKIITDFNHVGCCTTENIAIAPDGTIYVLGYKLEGNDMPLWRITNDGEKILLSDKLPIDPLSVAADGEGNIYVACSAGLLRIWKEEKNQRIDEDLEMMDKVKSGEVEINNAAVLVGIRDSNIILDCNDTCFLNIFRIFQDNAHLNCHGRKIRPENNAQVALVIEANNVSVVNCDISNFDVGIKILGSWNIIANNTITNNSKGGIIIEGDNNRVFDNYIRDNKWANIEIKAGSEKNIVFNNTMINTPGIYQPYTGSLAAIGILGSGNLILNNVIKNNHEIGIKITPLVVEDSVPLRNFVAGNVIENSSVLAIEITGAVVKDARTNTPMTSSSEGRNIIFNNTLASSKNEFGLRIRWSNENEIIKNLIYDNNWQGIHVFSANGNLIERNIIYHNREGIWLGDAHSNEIYSNVISNSVEHCGIVLTDWNNSTSSNNTIKSNTLVNNGNIHDDKQICDGDNNIVSENEFR